MVRDELQRRTIPAPAAFQPFAGQYTPRNPHRADGSKIEVNVYLDGDGKLVERWQISETDVRWYLLVEYRDGWKPIRPPKPGEVH